MIAMLPRGILALACAVALRTACAAAEVQELAVDNDGRTIVVTRYAAAGAGPRPTVLVLHGSSGLDATRPAYARYATTLAENGIDAYLVSYFGPRSGPGCHCVDVWAKTVADVTAAIRRRPDSSGRVGLVGFSLGGMVAAASARDAGVSALVVFYGFMPPEPRPSAQPSPALLALHGDADDRVPLEWGRELVERARKRGGRAELVVYPGEPHVLSTWSSGHATDAINRMIAFFRAELL